MDTTVEWLYVLAILTLAFVQFYLTTEGQYGIAIPVIIASWALWLVAFYLGVTAFPTLVILTIAQAVVLVTSVVSLVIERRRRNDGSD